MRRLFFAFLMVVFAVQARAQTSIAGKWQATTTPGTTWVFDLQVQGNKVTGTVSQTGDKTESAPIYFGSIEGNAVSFKVTSPDGDRIITFVGKITPVDIGFQQLVEVRPGGSRGDTGVFGGNALLNISVRRPAEGGRGSRGQE